MAAISGGRMLGCTGSPDRHRIRGFERRNVRSAFRLRMPIKGGAVGAASVGPASTAQSAFHCMSAGLDRLGVTHRPSTLTPCYGTAALRIMGRLACPLAQFANIPPDR